ncbi:putative MFS transporter [Xylogone sp. PMI_703]|nr:putative MFS transporter [Xylogone sp. PMI_703]
MSSTEESQNEKPAPPRRHLWPFGRKKNADGDISPMEEPNGGRGRPTKWSLGVMNDPKTHEVPGSVLLLTGHRNEPLGLRNAPARTSHSSLPAASPVRSRSRSGSRSLSSRFRAKEQPQKKTTKDGAIILDPQPEDSHNDPLNWPMWRRDAALLSLGFYCMMGGGMTPILAAGFNNISATYHVSTERVALTTGLYMMGLGVGSVFASPTAILFGKRPVYLLAAILFICSSVWCALSHSFTSLLVARVFQGIAVSPVECLPSATIAEIFFLHERAYRLGIYTLLLLGGKNLTPLVSAAIIQSLGWRWVFWVVAIIIGFCFVLLFLFVPETFWDRTPRPRDRSRSKKRSHRNLFAHAHHQGQQPEPLAKEEEDNANVQRPPLPHRPTQDLHVGFVTAEDRGANDKETRDATRNDLHAMDSTSRNHESSKPEDVVTNPDTQEAPHRLQPPVLQQPDQLHIASNPPTPSLYALSDLETGSGYFQQAVDEDGNKQGPGKYTTMLREMPRQTFVQQLRPWNGRLHYDSWIRVAMRPFILFAYPAVLWSSIVYACSIGWLIVLSESVSVIYRSKDTYNFSALSAGLIYLSPFIGGVLGTAVAGKVSDIIVRAMASRNGGLYEPEFRLVMAAPVAVTTVIGLMGYGWSAQVHDGWIVPTIFFGVISFGCSLGSTTSITFCVDSYRQYAGEALVTLNFSKNIFHGLVFSLFFNSWLESDGSRMVFIWLGVIQLILLTATVPMYIFGKRARMWTVRRNLMEKF